MNTLRVLVVNSDLYEAEHLAERLTNAQHTALPAAGLEEATEALLVQKFDAVLLGSALPPEGVADFTAKLRKLERSQRAGTPAPVLSLSSNVPDGADWCAGELGVDAYLADSFQPAVLFETVTGLAAAIARAGEPSVNASPEFPVFEVEQFRAQVSNDDDLMAEIIDLFLSEAPGQILEMREALAAQDFERLGRVAHTIKGSFASLHAEQARFQAQQLETAAKGPNGAQCRQALSALEHNLEILEPQLLSLKAALPK
ncbi:MAG TPA: Hpt domain-containing protein [Bryobacteraceae bacterium]|jgi:HPt (histidine-containing phosphotransfer) domain-containing protein|nr:Hpt domain-containing protein [Bryobacteraceae bacterium]